MRDWCDCLIWKRFDLMYEWKAIEDHRLKLFIWILGRPFWAAEIAAPTVCEKNDWSNGLLKCLI